MDVMNTTCETSSVAFLLFFAGSEVIMKDGSTHIWLFHLDFHPVKRKQTPVDRLNLSHRANRGRELVIKRYNET